MENFTRDTASSIFCGVMLPGFRFWRAENAVHGGEHTNSSVPVSLSKPLA